MAVRSEKFIIKLDQKFNQLKKEKDEKNFLEWHNEFREILFS